MIPIERSEVSVTGGVPKRGVDGVSAVSVLEKQQMPRILILVNHVHLNPKRGRLG